MHTPQRQNPQPAPAAKKPAQPAKRPAGSSAPQPLDDRALRHVSGAGPFKTW